MKNNNQKGISLIEILIVLSVLAGIFSIVIPQFSKTRELQVLKSGVSDILSILNKAQTQTLASVGSSSYGVHFDVGEVVIFKGTAFSAGATDNEVTSLTSPAFISNVTLGGVSENSGSLYFERLSGSPSKDGTVTVATPSFTKIITISPTGSVSVN